MKKILAILLAIMLLAVLTACGGGGNKSALTGTWEVTDGDGGEYGMGIRFTNDNKFYFSFASEMLGDTAELTAQELEEAFEAMDMLYTINYKLLSETQMELTVKAFGGLGGVRR